MPDQPIIIFCDNCGKGINLIAKETIYQCKECQGQVDNSCYNTDFKMCVACAAPKMKARADKAEREKDEAQAKLLQQNSEPIVRGLALCGIADEKMEFLKDKLLAKFCNRHPPVDICIATDYYSSTRFLRGKEGKQSDFVRFVLLVNGDIFAGGSNHLEDSFTCDRLIKGYIVGFRHKLHLDSAFDLKSSKAVAKMSITASTSYSIDSTTILEFSPDLSVSRKKNINEMLQRIDTAWKKKEGEYLFPK